jgi:hypothetical protein
MKLTAAILLMLIMFSSLFYYGYYNALVFHVKQEAREAIADGDNAKDLKLIKIPLKIASQNDEDEIWYDHQLYDIAKREVIKDTVYEYLYHDKEEESVLAEIGAFFKSDDDSFIAALPGTPVLKCVHTVPDQVYIFYSSVSVLKDRSTLAQIFSEKKYNILSKISEVLTPPPRAFTILS